MRKSQSLKVGLVFDDSLDSNDGVAQYVKTLGRWLSGDGHQVRYLAGQTKLSSWSGGRVYSLCKNKAVYFNGNKLSVPLPADRTNIRTILNYEKLDVLHVMMPHSPLMAQRVINYAAAETAIIGTFHIYPSGRMARAGGHLLSLWYGKKINKFDQIISVSRPAQAYAKDVFNIDSTIIPNAVETSVFKIPKPGRKSSKEIVFLGRLVKRKGCSELIDAFHELTNNGYEANLTIAGDGPQAKQLRTKCRRLGMADRVNFLGYVTEQSKPELLAGADIACFPSLYGESFGIVLLEAMAAGAAVVLGGDNPGYRSVLEDQPELLIDPANTQAFALRLKQLLENRLLIKRLHDWQVQTVAQYDINLVGPKILHIYNGQIARRTKKSNNKAHE